MESAKIKHCGCNRNSALYLKNKKIMKKYIIVLVLVFSFNKNFGQVGVIIPISNPGNYYDNLKNGTYIKDVYNVFGIYLGTWKATVNDKVFTLYLEKATKSLFSTPNGDYHFEDMVIGKYTLTSLATGEVLRNTRMRINPNNADFTSVGDPKNGQFEFLFIDHELCDNSTSIIIRGNPLTNQLRFVDQNNSAYWFRQGCPYAQKHDIPYPFPAGPFDLIKQ